MRSFPLICLQSTPKSVPKDKWVMILYLRDMQSSQIHRNTNNSVCEGLEGQTDGELLFNEYGVSVLEGEKMSGYEQINGNAVK